jgi:uncharacterized MnhB-related membrane protein
MLLYLALFVGAICCAVYAVRSRPLIAAIWLAGLSVIASILLYLHGAPEIAVIELSVGAGLITVLLAFAISMAEDESMPASLLPRPFARILVLVMIGLLLWLLLPQVPFVRATAQADAPFLLQVWDNRLLDLFVQIAIVISGIIGVLSLLGETRKGIAPQPEAER